jgi:hypothetical protein
MCDYSLHTVPNRLAVEGEQLVTHRFPTYSIGMASPADLEQPACTGHDSTKQGGSWWSVLKTWLSPPPLRNEKIPAVCIPPGARLRLTDVPRDMQQEFGIGPVEEVTFVELSASAYRYRDGIRFENGREVLLQNIREGVRLDVLSLESAEPEVTFRIEEEVPVRIR